MAQGCGTKCAKFLLFAFNFIFLLLSIGLIAIGGLGVFYAQKSGYAIGEDYISVPIALIVIGSTVFVLAFLGCCGAVLENYCMLMSFAVLIVILLIAEIAVGVLSYTHREHTKDIIQNNLRKSMHDYWKKSGFNSGRAAWDFVQTHFQCCGVNGPSDWTTEGGVPPSCGKPLYYTKGCTQAVEEKLTRIAIYVAVSGFILGAIQVLSVCLACILANNTN